MQICSLNPSIIDISFHEKSVDSMKGGQRSDVKVNDFNLLFVVICYSANCARSSLAVVARYGLHSFVL